MKIVIINRWTSETKIDGDFESLKDAVVKNSKNLREADLREADLRGADLSGANLRGADLCGADLSGADLRGADLCGADLCEAKIRISQISQLIESLHVKIKTRRKNHDRK